MSKELKIPKRLIVGYRILDDDMTQAVPTEIRISNRTKKSAFKIENEKSWKNKINDGISKIRVTNEFKSGFSFLKTDLEYFSSRASQVNFYLYQEDFKGHILISPENMFQLLQTCVINNGVIQNELIFDGTDFITKEALEMLTDQHSKEEQEFIDAKEALKDRKVFARDLIPGRIYQKPITRKNFLVEYIAYLGTVEDSQGDIFHITKDLNYSEHFSDIAEGSVRSIDKKDGTKIKVPRITNVSAVDLVDRYVRGRNQGSYKIYKGMQISNNSWYDIKYRKSIPSHYLPKADLIARKGIGSKAIIDVNVFNGYDTEDLNLIGFLLMNPSYNSPGVGPLKNIKTFEINEADITEEEI